MQNVLRNRSFVVYFDQKTKLCTLFTGILFARFSTVEFIPCYSEKSYVFSPFDVTVWVAGLTHIGLLPKNVIFGKESEENNSPTHRK